MTMKKKTCGVNILFFHVAGAAEHRRRLGFEETHQLVECPKCSRWHVVPNVPERRAA